MPNLNNILLDFNENLINKTSNITIKTNLIDKTINSNIVFEVSNNEPNDTNTICNIDNVKNIFR